jgi:tRNA G37 N-methylase Trm5
MEQIGRIAIMNVKDLKNKKIKELKKEAEKILKKPIETVLLKKEKVKGRLRKASYRLLAGKRQFETLHRENKCIFKLNVKDVYFSSRLSNNRLWTAKKILEIVRKKKLKRPSILVMFSGIGVYGIVIARLLKDSGIDYSMTMIEINRKAVKYAKENVKINRLDGIEILQGDVRKVLPRLAKFDKAKYDFVVMPRPKLKYDFFREAFINAKRKSIVFYFDFVKESELAEEEKRIIDKAKQLGKKIRVLEIKKAGEIGVRKYRVVVVFEIL